MLRYDCTNACQWQLSGVGGCTLIVWGLAAGALPGLGTSSYLKRPGGGNLYVLVRLYIILNHRSFCKQLSNMMGLSLFALLLAIIVNINGDIQKLDDGIRIYRGPEMVVKRGAWTLLLSISEPGIMIMTVMMKYG